MRSLICNTRILIAVVLFAAAFSGSAAAQSAGTTSSSGTLPTTQAPPTGVPVYGLYRAFFQHVASLENSASDLEARGNKGGGSDLRKFYEKALGLTPPEAAQLKKSAASCNSQLAQQDSQAKTVVANAHAAAAAAAGLNTAQGLTQPLPSTALTQLQQLEQGRTAISNSCIQSLQSSLSARTFSNIDLYVKTVIAGHASASHPPLQKLTPPTISVATAAGMQK